MLLGRQQQVLPPGAAVVRYMRSGKWYPARQLERFFARGARYVQFSKPGVEKNAYSNCERCYVGVNPESRLVTMLGAYWSVHVHDARVLAGKNYKHELEFVVDIDLSDYDTARRVGLRTPAVLGCAGGCAGAKRCCARCWLLIEMAHTALHFLLTERCGLGEPLVVFSGSKGCHFWFGNERARQLTPEQRQALRTEFVRLRSPAALDALSTSTKPGEMRFCQRLLDVWRNVAVANKPEGRAVLQEGAGAHPNRNVWK